VKDLIEMLEDVDPNLPVVFQSDYGDHSHTQQVHGIQDDCEVRVLYETGYSHSGWKVRDSDEDDDNEDDQSPVALVLF